MAESKKYNYTIRVESANPEMRNDELINGIEADGYVLLVVRGGKPYCENVSNVNISEMSEFFKVETECAAVLRQAAAIGEGFNYAKRIAKETTEAKGGNIFAELLKEAMKRGD